MIVLPRGFRNHIRILVMRTMGIVNMVIIFVSFVSDLHLEAGKIGTKAKPEAKWFREMRVALSVFIFLTYYLFTIY